MRTRGLDSKTGLEEGASLVDMAKVKTSFRCGECGHQASKWVGRCSACGGWNTMTEERELPQVKGKNEARSFRLPENQASGRAMPLSEVTGAESHRHPTGIREFDRVLGGGLVPGALILVGGDPGIGKSTLLLQALDQVGRKQGKRPVLYVSGEESPNQVKLRADRLGVEAEKLLILAETRTDRVIAEIERLNPSCVVIDSIQAVYDPEIQSAPGSVAQIREVAARFLYLAKARGLPTLLVGHVTKEGSLAGPRVLEHMVDTVLYFESSAGHPYRILRAHKNRFGSTNEIGVFEMADRGLAEVANPSELFLAERPEGAPGSSVLPALEGTRPILVEVQALVSPTNYGQPRRTCLGFDSHRAALLVAVLERRGGLQLLGSDIFVNVAGGVNIVEPAADLAVALALASSLRNRPLPAKCLIFGEVGLAGELRAVSQPELRVAEGLKLGFQRAILPKANAKKLKGAGNIEILAADNVETALDLAMSE